MSVSLGVKEMNTLPNMLFFERERSFRRSRAACCWVANRERGKNGSSQTPSSYIPASSIVAPGGEKSLVRMWLSSRDTEKMCLVHGPRKVKGLREKTKRRGSYIVHIPPPYKGMCGNSRPLNHVTGSQLRDRERKGPMKEPVLY